MTLTSVPKTNFVDRQPKIVAVATATPSTSFNQNELLDLFRVQDRRVRSVFTNGSIANRFLSIPLAQEPAALSIEAQGDLLRRHRDCGLDIGTRSIKACLRQIGADVADVRYLCCVTSTGLLTPGFSALLIHDLKMHSDCTRLDIVGMGCSAGLNGLNVVAHWAEAHPGQLAVMVCIEVCSAIYVDDGTIQTAVVNSLFADGAGAVAVMADAAESFDGPTVVRFASCMIPDSLDAMKFTWNETHGKFSFLLQQDVPYIIGSFIERAVDSTLRDRNLRRADIAHWIVHSGGKKVIDSIKINLGLTTHDLRHTSNVLREYGNVSSGSFLFSLERLLAENCVKPDEYGMLITMGPGSAIETALIRW